jgi:signal transduction histidine kinase/ActR/RegA family two-component response regulator
MSLVRPIDDDQDGARERVLILAPRGRDAFIAKRILREANIRLVICLDLSELAQEIRDGCDTVIVTEEALRAVDLRELIAWVRSQPPWSDLPFILLTEHGGGIERNPGAARLMDALGNVTFLERPFHPTTLVSVVQTGLRGRRRQHECRRLNEELESRVQERTAELAAANRQLLAQIEERERVESTLRQLQRLEAVGQLTSGVAHDFNNLLTVVLASIRFLEKRLSAADSDGAIAKRLGYMRAAAERGAKLTDQLLSFSRRQRLEPVALDLNKAIEGMRDLLHSSMGGSVRIDTNLDAAVWPALVDPTQLELAVLNLAINARDASEVGSSVLVKAANVKLGPPLHPEEPPAGEYVMICVADNGAGMPPEVRAKVFEPFFTTKEVGKGSGLGLSQVLGFAKQSGGGIRIETRLGEGTAVYIFLPRAEKQEGEPASKAGDAAAHAAPEGTVILLVDDDKPVREVTAGLLQDFGYLVIEAGSGGAALDILDREQKIDLMVIDFAMPGMNGAEVARRVQDIRPTMPILFITGFANQAALEGVSEAFIIGKPFVDDELAAKVRVALESSVSSKVVRLRRKDGEAIGSTPRR